jgi:hypothetical protein
MTETASEALGSPEKLLPPLLERHFDFCVWIIQRVRKFDTDLRNLLGKNIIDLSLRLMDLLVVAFQSGKGNARLSYLQEADLLLEQLRLKLRMAYKLKLLPARSLHFAAGLLMDEGKMIGGWIRKEKNETSEY